MIKHRLPNRFSGIEFQSKYCLMANRFISDLSFSQCVCLNIVDVSCDTGSGGLFENSQNANPNCKYANYAYSSFGLLIFCAQM